MLVTANILGPLIDVFAAVIKFFHDTWGISWGLSIILLTVCVRLVLSPLMVKQFHSMRRMQHLQPQMKALQKKYKGDKQRQQEEMMKFYRENDVNPLTSCLPMLAQAPVLYALYFMLEDNLRVDICRPKQLAYQAAYAAAHHVPAHTVGKTTPCGHVPGAGFLFIPDITNKATGLALIILIILYVGTQVLSMTVSMMQSPTMNPKQQRLMMLMPVVFVIFIIRFPAGLLVYWITSNAWTMVQGFGMRRMMGPPPVPVVAEGAEDEDDDSSGGMFGGLTEMWRNMSGSSNGDDRGRDHDRGRKREKDGGRVRSGPVVPPPSPRKKKKRSGRRR